MLCSLRSREESARRCTQVFWGSHALMHLALPPSRPTPPQQPALPASMAREVKKWIPLESNPDVLNEFAQKLGLNVSEYAFCDIYGLDQELLAMVPRPVAAVLLLFPITEETEAARKQQQEAIEKAGQEVSPSIYYMKQTIGNACGTIGVLHAIGNNLDKLQIGEGSFLQQFFAATAGMGAAERGAYLEHPPQGAPSIDTIHEEAAQQGATAAPSAEEDVDLHFIAFVQRDGCLYELDGRKASAINHGPSSADTLLEDTAAVVRREFVDKSDSLNFNMIALAAPAVDD